MHEKEFLRSAAKTLEQVSIINSMWIQFDMFYIALLQGVRLPDRGEDLLSLQNLIEKCLEIREKKQDKK